MKKQYFVSVILIVFAHSGLFSQGWEKVYFGIYSNCDYWGPEVQKMAIASDGGYVLIGHGNDGSSNFEKSYLIKTNSSGDIIWSKILSDSSSIIAKGIIETNGGFLICGNRYSQPSNFLTKVDQNGNILWTKNYIGAGELGMMLKTTSGVIIMGRKNGNTGGVYLSEINNTGGVLWNKTVSMNRFYPKGIETSNDGGFVVIGIQDIYTYGKGIDCHLMKFDSTGNMLWNKSYGYNGHFTPHTIKVTTDGDYIIGGKMLMKVDKDGNLIWVKGCNYMRYIKDIYQTADNGFIAITGEDWNPSEGIFLEKLNPDGVIEWETEVGGKHDDSFTVLVTPDKGFLIAGYHNENVQNRNGLYLVKTDSIGQTGCNPSYSFSPSYPLHPILCVVNTPATTISSNTNSGNLMISSNSVTVNTVNPCCFAKANLEIDYYYHSVCSGDSLHYNGYGAPHLLWSTGDTTTTTITMDTIVYLTATNTCGSFKDTIMVHPGWIPSFTYNINKDTICKGDSVLLTITGNAPYYSCYGNNVKIINDTSYVLKPTGTSSYNLYGVTSNYGPGGCGSQQSFTIYVSPDKPIITKIADTLFSSSPINNQWLLNGNNINGATSQSLIINQPGNYAVQITGSGCGYLSEGFLYTPDTIEYVRNAWQKIIRSGGSGSGTCIVQGNDGGLIIGSNYSFGGDKYSAPRKEDIALLKTDRNGEVIWGKTYGGDGTDHINSIIKVNNGYLAVASTNSFSDWHKDVYILSFDEQGELLWSKTYGDWNDQEGYSIEQTSDGGFIVCGYSTNPHTFTANSVGNLINENDLYLLKIDSNGNLLWSKRYDNSNNECGIEVHESSDGNYIVAGYSADEINHKERVYVLKTDGAGNLIWSKLILSSSAGLTTSMKITSDNNYLICTRAGTGTALIKLDDNGIVLWSKLLHGIRSQSMVVINDNAAVFAYGSMTKIDINGDLIWSNSFDNNFHQDPSTVIQLKDSSFLLTGNIDETNSYQSGQINFINTDKNGQTNCSQSYYPSITYAPYSYYPDTTIVSSLGIEMNAPTNSYSGVFQSRTICESASLVAAPLTSNKIICSGSSILLSAVGTGTIGWYSEAIAGSYLGGGANFITPALTTTTTYYVQDSTIKGSSSRTAVLVTVNPSPPLAPAASNKTICSGGTTSLFATGIGTLGWYSDATLGSYLGAGENYITPILTANTTYYVQDSTCASSLIRTPLLVTVNTLPTVIANTSDTLVCNGTSVILSGTGASSYTWTGGITDGLGFVPSSSTTYTVTGTDTNQCSNTSTITINVNLLDLTTNFNGGTITANQNGAVYQWLDCSNGNSPLVGGTNQSYTPQINGEYAVIITKNNCSDTSACINITTNLINEIVKTNSLLTVYPNPSNGSFTIQSTIKGVYSITNETGQTIQVFELNSTNKYSINIENLSNGIYFIVGVDNKQMIRQKVVVVK